MGGIIFVIKCIVCYMCLPARVTLCLLPQNKATFPVTLSQLCMDIRCSAFSPCHQQCDVQVVDDIERPFSITPITKISDHLARQFCQMSPLHYIYITIKICYCLAYNKQSPVMHYNTKIKTKLKYTANNSYSARNACR